VVAVASADHLTIRSLTPAVVAQRLEGDRVKGEAAAAPLRLGRRLVHAMVDDHPGDQRRDGGMVEVDVDPAQPGELAAAHAGRGDQQPQRVQPVVEEVLQESAQLLASPVQFGLGRSGWAVMLVSVVWLGLVGTGAMTTRLPA
jgi:hypothetical protein